MVRDDTGQSGEGKGSGIQSSDAAADSVSAQGNNRKSPPDKKNAKAAASESPPREVGGRDGPDPTRYGDWEKNGRCIDF